MRSTHIPVTLRKIPLGILNCLAKLNSRKLSFRSEIVENVYPDHLNALRKVGLAHPIFPTMGELWKGQDEKWILRKKENPESTKRKTGMYIFSLHTHGIFLNISTG